MAIMMFKSPSHVLRALVKLLLFSSKYVAQKDSSWMNGKS